MSSLIRSRSLCLAAFVMLAAGCDREAAPAQSSEVTVQEGVRPAPSASGASSAQVELKPAREASSAAPDLTSIVLKREDVQVGGAPACALLVAYPGGDEQPLTWRGERCAQIMVRLSNIADLRRLGQHVKLSEETQDDLARLPSGKAIYIEGQYSSAIYPQNVAGRVYEVPLAD